MKKFLLSLVFTYCLTAAYPQWVQLCTDFLPTIAITTYDSTVIAGISYNAFDLALSHDAGITWTGTSLPGGADGVSYLHTGKIWVYACTPNGVYRADKDNLDWMLYNQGLPVPVLEVIERDSILLAFDSNKLFKRGLDDSAWTVLSDNIPHDNITGIDFEGNLIVIAGNHGVCESEDMGVSWSFWIGLDYVIGKIIIKGDTIIHASPGGITRKLISTGSLANVSDGLIKLWTPPPGWYFYGTFEQFHRIGDNIFLCGETGAYKLNDTIWHWEHTGLESWTYCLADNGETLFAVKGYGGIWGRPLDQMILSSPEVNLPVAPVALYPNPSSGHIMVRSDKTIRELKIFNHLGQFIEVFHPADHFFKCKLTDHSTGIYFFHLTTDDGPVVRKVIFL
ncbi:MAG: T9SS type A sorting domain-containing protein [Bacteroidales bacterium]